MFALSWGPHAGQAGSVPPRSTEIEVKGPFFHGSAIEVSRAQLYCHVQKLHVIHEAETVRHTDRRFGRWLKFHSRKALITAPRGPNVSVDLYLTRGNHHITGHQTHGTLSESISHCHLTGNLHRRYHPIEQRLSLNRPSYRNSPKTVPDSASHPGSCIRQESRCSIWSRPKHLSHFSIVVEAERRCHWIARTNTILQRPSSSYTKLFDSFI